MATKYTGDEHLAFEGMPTNYLVSDFLSWFASDLLPSYPRQLFAEFIVTAALGLNTEKHENWVPFFTTYKNKVVEIKSAGYIPYSGSDTLVAPLFGIAPIYQYDEGEVVKRSRRADLYVFCLLDCVNKDVVDPIKLEQWRFFILPTSVLNEKCKEKNSLTVEELKALSPTEATYEGLQRAVDALL